MDSVSQDIVDTWAGFALIMSKFNPDMKIRHLVAMWPGGRRPGCRYPPAEAWNATAKALPPEPPTLETRKSTPRHSIQRKVGRKGEVTVLGMHFYIGMNHAGEQIHVLHDEETIMFFDTRGTEIISHRRPPKGTVYIGITRPPKETSTKS